MSGLFWSQGAPGFIGSALVRGLLARGRGTGRRGRQSAFRPRAQSGREYAVRSNFISIDIRDYEALRSAMTGVEMVFHEAAIPSVPRSIREPVPSHDVNINGTFNVLRAAQDAGVRRVVYAASSSAYGDTPVLPKVETMQTSPKSPYAAQKLMGEYYMSVWASCFGLETVSLRYFNVFGPRQDPSSAYSGVLVALHESDSRPHLRPPSSAMASNRAISLTWKTWSR